MAVIRKYNSQKVYYQAVTKTTTEMDILMTDLGLTLAVVRTRRRSNIHKKNRMSSRQPISKNKLLKN